MTGDIYCSEFKTVKAPHIMRKRVSYTNNRETGGQTLPKSLLEKSTLGKMFWKDSHYYIWILKLKQENFLTNFLITSPVVS